MPVNDVLLGIIRVLTILLLVLFIITGYYGVLMVQDLQSTMHTRLANGEFPLPTGGIDLGNEQNANQAGQSGGQSNQGTQGPQFDLSTIKDPSEQNYLKMFLDYMNKQDSSDAYSQLNQLDVYLAQKGDTQSQAKLQELKAALDSGNNNAAESRMQELVQLLSK